MLQLDESLAGIRSQEGRLYTAGSLYGYLLLLYETYRLTIDIRLFDPEWNEGVVGVPAFLLSRRVAHFLQEALPVPWAVLYYLQLHGRLSTHSSAVSIF